jgi:lysophospholipase L1-like esterase
MLSRQRLGWLVVLVWGGAAVVAGCQGVEPVVTDPSLLVPGSGAVPPLAPLPPPSPPAADTSPPTATPPIPPPPPEPRPARFIVLGDSIAACSNLGGKNDPDCSAGKLYDYLKVNYAPALTYENEAVGGAVSADVVHWQLPRVKAGPGHAFVLVYVGGNDLGRYLLSLDVSAEQGFIETLPKVLTVWELIVAALEDEDRFPDGYTLLMNNQYNPFDDCTAAPYFMSERKNHLVGVFNDALADFAERKDALLADQYTPFLGHGHHHAVRACPHYRPDLAPYMGDLIHPNPAGHELLFRQWQALVDGLYRP